MIAGRPDLTALKSVDRADVYKADRLAGGLERDGDRVVFSYQPDYRAGSATPIAATLPLDGSPVSASAGSVPPFFAGLLPEGVRLQAVVTGTKTSPDDHLTLLMALGADSIGDVRVVPAGTALVEPAPAVTDDDFSNVDLLAVFNRATSADPDDLERIALPGVQAKVSAAMISTPIGTPAGPAILKLNPPTQPLLLQNENFFLDLARSCGMPVPAHRLVTDAKGQPGLVVQRFDRFHDETGTLRRLEQEDGCQLLNVYPSAKYRVKTEDVAGALGHWVEGGDGSRPLALRRILQLVAFSHLIGNGDLHAKNLSGRRRPDGIREMTPVYDVLCTQPYLNWRDPMALNFYGRANRLTRSHLMESAARLGLPVRAARSALDEICEGAGPGIDRLTDIGFDARVTELLRLLLTSRLREIRGDRDAG